MTPLVDVAIALPGYAVVLFCCYSLAVVGIGLFTFPECPQAETELLQDIKRAKRGLEERGFRF